MAPQEDATRELEQSVAKLKQTRKDNKAAEAVVTARQQMKAYSLQMLGAGRKGAGTKQHHDARMEVMGRLRRAAELSPSQTADWEYFKTTWDHEMAAAMGEDWAETFAQNMQQVIIDLAAGKTNALSEFMHRETQRVLVTASALIVPGAP